MLVVVRQSVQKGMYKKLWMMVRKWVRLNGKDMKFHEKPHDGRHKFYQQVCEDIYTLYAWKSNLETHKAASMGSKGSLEPQRMSNLVFVGKEAHRVR